MTFRVEYTSEAEADLNGILDWLISQYAGLTGLRWFERLEKAIASLAEAPQRCPFRPRKQRLPVRGAPSALRSEAPRIPGYLYH
jgi:plasmid stabilization system protein ParE